ncbi:MAG: aspartate aminotransferase family protein [Spirochaetaceae bacterium]|nr:aspartate aminotransferase family protein [Spirochaetaceae bacterium]|tara:strand:+ start:24943 stop:26190 length:1248 start_codon:yes stop_codon:yes gene_type:complete
MSAEQEIEQQESDFTKPLSLEEIQEKSDKYLLGTYRRAPMAFYFGQGEYLYDSENNAYLDFLCGISVTNLGHGEADLIEAIRDQADRILHTSNLFYNQEQALLAEALIEHSFPGKVFLCNSGTEANEAALKLARRNAENMQGTPIVIALENSFHGRTTGAMAMTGQDKIRQGFGPLMEGMVHIPANDIEALESAFDQYEGRICAMIMELVQGEGGIKPMDQDFVIRARELTKSQNALLILDEIQTGMGRTAKLFAYEHYKIQPDAMTLAKALGAGLPIGAMIVADDFTHLLEAGMHGSTFGGNHVVARAAYENLRIIMGREILKNAEGLSDYFFRRLRLLQETCPIVKDVRGIGLHIGVELTDHGPDVVTRCREEKLLVNCTAGHVIRIMPPLNLPLDSAAEGLDIFERVVREFA